MQETRLYCSVKVFKTVRERHKNHYKHEAPTAGDCLALHLMSLMRICCGDVTIIVIWFEEEGVVVAAYYDDWNREMTSNNL